MFEKIRISFRKRVFKPKSWRPGRLAKGTVVMTLGMGIRAIGQGLVFLILAHVLGASGYGGYASVLVLSMVFGGVVGFGVSIVMLRDTSRKPEVFSERWGNTLASLVITTPLLLVFYFLVSWAFLPEQVPWIVVICVGISEMILAPFTFNSIQVFQAHERIGQMARIVLAPIFTRSVAALFLLLFYTELPPSARLSSWGWLYLLSNFLVAIYAAWRLKSDMGVKFVLNRQNLGHAMRQGWPFSITGASQKISADIDKVMLARLLTLEAAGIYAAAYRIIEISTVPLLSLFSVAATRLSRAGGEGTAGAFFYMLRIMPFLLLYALAMGLLVYFGAWIVPWLLGNGSFAQVVLILHWLAWLPIISMPRRFLQASTGFSGRQLSNMYIVFFGMGINVIINLLAIPRVGWLGAVIAAYVAEGSMLVLLFASIVRSWNNEKNLFDQ